MIMIYFGFFFFSLLVYVFGDNKPQYFKFYLTALVFVIFSIIFGFRIPELGSDTISYIYIFENDYEFREFGFDLFVRFLASVGLDSELFIFCMTGLVFGTTISGYYRLSKETILLALLLFSCSYTLYSFSLNIMRQGIASGFTLIALSYTLDRKLHIAFIYWALSLCFHTSALFVAPALLICSFDIIKVKKIKVMIFLTLIYFLFLVIPSTEIISSLVVMFLGGTGIGTTLSRHIGFWNRGNEGPWITLSSFIPFFIAYFYVWNNSYRLINLDNRSRKIITYYIIGFISCSPFVYIHLMYSRLAWYFFVLEPVILSIILNSIYKSEKIDKKSRYLLYFVMFFLMILYMCKTYFLTGGILREISYDQVIF